MCILNLGSCELHTVLHALEYRDPYTLSMLFVGEPYCRIDISKDQLASELKQWLNGKRLVKAAVSISERIRCSIMDFIKFGTPPKQTDLFLWLLSRTEVLNRGDSVELYFGGINHPAARDENTTIQHKTISSKSTKNFSSSISGQESLQQGGIKTSRPKSAPTQRRRRDDNNALSNFDVTEQILGKSNALAQLPQQRVKGREGATQSYVRVDWTDDHYRLTNHITSRRQELEDKMESRRKILEVSHARQVKSMEKFRKLRESITKNRSDYNWAKDASYEVNTLDRMNETIEEDIRRQKSRAIRTAEHVRWTMAPNGFVNRRGRYTKGIVIGPGPLPADATTALHDPRITYAVNHFYWDQHGRRHIKTAADIDEGSVVAQAMEAIRRASVNASLYKLNLKTVFHEMDTSGDGFITISEMGRAFVRLGLKLEDKVLDALFSHFDPNNSGSVHYGEFVWAFFNRRSMVAQWTRATKGMTKAQVRTKFRKGDVNGDGKLGKKEFKRLLASFSIKLSDSDVDILIDRFDRDGDGDLDLYEFADFVDKEMSVNAVTTASKVSSSIVTKESVIAPLGSPLSRPHANQSVDSLVATQVSGVNPQRPRVPISSDVMEVLPESDDDDPPQYEDDLDKTEVQDYSKVRENLAASKTVNLELLAQSLQRQATLESKLGKKYYGKKL